MKRIALICNRGFSDLLVLGRQNRPDPYALCTPQSPWEQWIPARQRLEIDARIDAAGEQVQPLDLDALIAQLEPLAPELDAVAVCLLFSWRNPAHERAIAQALARHFPALEIGLSHGFGHLHTEYERTLQTVLALAGPLAPPAPPTAVQADAPTLAHRLGTIADGMQSVLVEQAVSSIAREAMDCAAAIFLPDGRLIAQARSLPLLLGSLSPAVRGLLAAYPAEGMRAGDGFMLNDPWAGGTHLPDITLVRPVFHAGRLAALLACILHHQDVGGTAAGSLPSNATHIHQEGIIIPPLRLYQDHAIQPDILRLLQANSRTPENLRGDLAAQWQALLAGEPPLQELLAQAGSGFEAQCAAQLAASAALARAAIAQLPEGEYGYADALDGDGVVPDQIRIAVRLTVRAGEIEVDLSGCADQCTGPANASRGAVQAAITYFARILAPHGASDEGCLEPIRVRHRPGSLVDPQYPAAVNARTNLLKILVNALLGALAQADPARFPAPNAGAAVVLSMAGRRADGRPWMYTEIIAAGAGGTPQGAGAAGVSTDISNARNTPAEVLEAQAPLRVETVAVRAGSGGAGRHRGGDGVLRRYRLLEGTATLSYRGERHSIAPQGVLGGQPGECAQAFIERAGGETLALSAKSTATLFAGDRLTIATAGAGGWGAAPSSS
ncbi:hydantoinase B/oxoprolinase family protein [Comamonas endophytica]|uniref:Hydantoinase B/oxoprolinase family protein n=1 Tax=Comamonas endophytica TaxID=2949090 RepID=A0ABY6G897_9BURK|nr:MULTISPECIES: hydantoinase B/oxoprolinase family protein [unclassified Acidovorax]MCD2511295.1 hydantoinase B/oxoprolinase family protein [Acidovorax sp. D4N7]UYG50689.1 hydantoinase B/oxoprolinase family protein [Acidovorax sp. 5MLIR]